MERRCGSQQSLIEEPKEDWRTFHECRRELSYSQTLDGRRCGLRIRFQRVDAVISSTNEKLAG